METVGLSGKYVISKQKIIAGGDSVSLYFHDSFLSGESFCHDLPLETKATLSQAETGQSDFQNLSFISSPVDQKGKISPRISPCSKKTAFSFQTEDLANLCERQAYPPQQAPGLLACSSLLGLFSCFGSSKR